MKTGATDGNSPEYFRRWLVLNLRCLPGPEWRNWQTHGTQNPASFTWYVGSTPTSGTKSIHN
jgi:hypothetical protein